MIADLDLLRYRCLLCQAEPGEPCTDIDTEEDGVHRIRAIDARGEFYVRVKEPEVKP